MDLVANRAPSNGTVLELGFRVDPKSIPQFMKLNGSVRNHVSVWRIGVRRRLSARAL
jgi:hypothetical protein